MYICLSYLEVSFAVRQTILPILRQFLKEEGKSLLDIESSQQKLNYVKKWSKLRESNPFKNEPALFHIPKRCLRKTLP